MTKKINNTLIMLIKLAIAKVNYMQDTRKNKFAY